MAKKKSPQRYGIFYRSNGRWTSSPYAGVTFTRNGLKNREVRENIADIQNYVLKSKIMVLPVKNAA